MTASETIKRVLSPLRLTGGGQLPNRILPGPMEGIMRGDYCRAMMEFDLIPLWITPFVRILDTVPRRSVLMKRIEPYRGKPMIVQLMGTNRQSLAAAAREIVSNNDILGIEINCCCPSAKVLQSGAGSALLQDPLWIGDTLSAIREAVPETGIGVKVRSGLQSSDELEGIMAGVLRGRPDYVVLHYRTAKEMYQRVTNGWERFTIAKAILETTPLLASGDLLSVENCRELLSTSPVDGITPARGLLKNPWLLREIEADLNGGDYAKHNVAAFLIRLIEIGMERPNWQRGNILDIARMAWGGESSEFDQLVQAGVAGEMLKFLETICSNSELAPGL